MVVAVVVIEPLDLITHCAPDLSTNPISEPATVSIVLFNSVSNRAPLVKSIENSSFKSLATDPCTLILVVPAIAPLAGKT